MNLPIFSDNLRSSASWADLLARARVAWDQARQSSEMRERIEARARQEQVKQALRRAERGIDEQLLLESVNLVSAWTADPDAKLNAERLLDLHRTLTGAQAGADV